MTEAARIVRGALGLLRVVDATEAPEAEDYADGQRALNAMMAAWLVDGWDLGWTPVSNPDDEITSPTWADEALTYNLALKLRPFYGSVLDPDTVAIATSGRATIAAYIARKVEEEHRPRVSYCDLPVGTGQRWCGRCLKCDGDCQCPSPP